MRTVADRLVRGEVADADLAFARPQLRSGWIETLRDAYATADVVADANGSLEANATRYERARAMETSTLGESARRIFRPAGEALVLAGPAATLRPIARRAWDPELTPPPVRIPPPAPAERPPRSESRVGVRASPRR